MQMELTVVPIDVNESFFQDQDQDFCVVSDLTKILKLYNNVKIILVSIPSVLWAKRVAKFELNNNVLRWHVCYITVYIYRVCR